MKERERGGGKNDRRKQTQERTNGNVLPVGNEFLRYLLLKTFFQAGRYRLPRPRFPPPSTKIPVANIPRTASGTNRFPTDRAQRLDEIVRIAPIDRPRSIVTHPRRRFSAFGPRFKTWRGGARAEGNYYPRIRKFGMSFEVIPVDIFTFYAMQLVWNYINNYLANKVLLFCEKKGIFFKIAKLCEDVCQFEKLNHRRIGTILYFKDWLNYLQSVYDYLSRYSSRNPVQLPGDNLSLKQDETGEDQREHCDFVRSTIYI